MELNVTKVADRLITRLFNHRQFTSGEINYLVKEVCNPVEESLPRILSTNQSICLIADKNTENCLQVAKDVLEKVSSLPERANELLKSEEYWRQRELVALDEPRKKHEKSMRDCNEDIKRRLERLNESLVNEELELEQSYLSFEKRHLQQN